VVVGGGTGQPVQKVLEASVFSGNKPPMNKKVPTTLVTGDVINVRRSQLVSDAQGVQFQRDLVSDYTVSASGTIVLREGIVARVAGLTLEEAATKIGADIAASNSVQNLEFETVVFPMIKAAPYTIGPGDVLGVNRLVVDVSQDTASQSVTTTESVVSPSGVVSILGVGDIEVGGLTLSEARRFIEQEALRSSLSTDLTVDILKFESRSVLLTGEITSSLLPISDQVMTVDRLLANLNLSFSNGNDYSLKLERDGRRYRMLASQILSEFPRDSFVLLDGDRFELNRVSASNPVEVTLKNAGTRSVTYLRVFGGVNSTPSTSQEVFLDSNGLDLRQLLVRNRIDVNQDVDRLVSIQRGQNNFRLSAQDILLRNSHRRVWLEAGDHVVVEDLAYVGNSVLLVGELRRPSLLPIDQTRRTTLVEALFSAEIFSTADTDFNHIYVLRGQANSYEAFHFEIGNVLNLSLAEKFELRPSDIVFARKRPLSRYNRALALALTYIGSLDAIRDFANE
jgi:polysaccharide export outer membrane protein